jgi:CHAT domain-containing protein
MSIPAHPPPRDDPGLFGCRELCLLVCLAFPAGAIPHEACGQTDSRPKASAANVQTLIDEANVLRRTGKFADAARLARRVDAELRQNGPAENPDSARLRAWSEEIQELDKAVSRAVEFTRRREFDEAIVSASVVLALERRHYEKGHGQIEQAKQWVAGLEKRRRELQEIWSMDEAQIGRLLRDGNADAAVAAMDRLIRSQQQELGESHTLLADTLERKARLDEARDQFRLAADSYQAAADIHQRIFGKDHWRTIDTNVALDESRRIAALPPEQRRRLMEIRRRSHALVSLSRPDEIRRQIPRLLEDLEMIEQSLGVDNSFSTALLSIVGGMYRETGDYLHAEPMLSRAEAVSRRLYGRHHPDYVAIINGLGVLHSRLGDRAKALELAEQSENLARSIWGEYHPRYLSSLNNLGAAQLLGGQRDAAQANMERAFELTQSVNGYDDVQGITILQNLAEVHCQSDRLDEGRTCSSRALTLSETALGPDHPKTFDLLNQLATIERSRGDFAEAERLYLQMVERSRRSRGEGHPDHARTLANLGGLYQGLGDDVRAEPLLRSSLEVQRRNMDQTFSVLSERQQFAMGNTVRGVLFGYLSSALRLMRPADEMWQHVLAWKGAVQLHQREIRLAAEHPELAALFSELQETSRQLATLSFGPALGADAWKQQAENLVRERERIENELGRRSTAFLRTPAGVAPGDVQAMLPSRAALVDFFVINRTSPNEKTGGLLRELRLIAFVVRRDRPVEVVDLGALAPIHQLGRDWREHLIAGAGNAARAKRAREIAAELRQQLWSPLEKHLDAVEMVMVSPDGITAQLPLAALPGRESDRYLLEEYTMTLVPVPALLPQLARERTTAGADSAQSLLLVGGVDFDTAGNLPVPPPAAETALAARSSRQSPMKFPPLPGTEREASAIGDIFEKQFPKGRLHKATGQTATEAWFRQEAPGCRILHLATHGFFLNSDHGDDPSPTSVRSGIALAAANRGAASDGELRTDDGILTDVEVGTLDLRRAELVVLSACETGLGAYAGGEGLLGLQRAFQIAGARTTVTSLWTVDDAATEALMSEFYRLLWEDGLQAPEAFRRAQIAMLNHYDPKRGDLGMRGLKLLSPRNSTPSADTRLSPYFWAAFMVSGSS